MSNFKIKNKAILPLGFKSSGIACGLKKSGKLDLALFFSESPAIAAGLFTTNKMLAAPVILDKYYLKTNKTFKAVIVNSGNANCFTGRQGLADAKITSKILAKALNIKPEAVLVASTGIIGKKLAVDKIKSGIPLLINKLSLGGLMNAQKAIMTTDTFKKEFTVKFNIGKETVTVCGVAKGAGMIAPNMATMLAFIFTDALISPQALNLALKHSVEQSFNCITVDGCMSTNDSVICLANGQALNREISKGKDLDLFSKALNRVCLELAKMIIRDAEGANKFIKIQVSGALNLKQARMAALSIANSNLFKTAIYGENPNFGRIVQAIGSSGAQVNEENLKIRVSSLKKKDVDVLVNLGQGKAGLIVYTCDLTPEYIKINAEYN